MDENDAIRVGRVRDRSRSAGKVNLPSTLFVLIAASHRVLQSTPPSGARGKGGEGGGGGEGTARYPSAVPSEH
jgi:hypothetical protein